MGKRLLYSLLALAVFCTSLAPAATAFAVSPAPVAEEDTDWVPNQVMVMFSGSAEGFLEGELKDDIILEDCLDFSGGAAGEGFQVALVSSEKYDTETLMEKLDDQPGVLSVEPNHYTCPASTYEYSLNDPMNPYLYHVNSPQGENQGGSQVRTGDAPPENMRSIQAGALEAQLSGREEVVVAVTDSGIHVTHEDLKDMLWTNPGNIGLPGEHGYNFGDDNGDLSDTRGHGTHCAGIIAAEANNGKGIAGVAGQANVKIMMLGDGKNPQGVEYQKLASFQYVLKAKQQGVNVVATSNSWGNPTSKSRILREIFNQLGEAGILSFCAAGNSAESIDDVTDNPGSHESPYALEVGNCNADGDPVPSSNYGALTVDFFVPGSDILSTVSYPCYFPNIDTSEKRQVHTDLYGVFPGSLGNSVTPTAGGEEGLRAFRAPRALVINKGDPDAPAVEAEAELKIVKEHAYTASDDPGSLKITLRNVNPEKQYVLFFPYEKDPKTTEDNTFYSVLLTGMEGNFTCTYYCGDMLLDNEGKVEKKGSFNFQGVTELEQGHCVHLTNSYAAEGAAEPQKMFSAEEAGGRQVGLAVCLDPSRIGGEDQGSDLTFYLDSIAVSKPGADISADSSYDLMSGTSMACPAAAGAAALLASIYPRAEDQSPAEYALWLKAKLLSCVRPDERYTGLCKTGGTLDLSLLKEDRPVITDAVCDLDDQSLILSGLNLRKDMTLTYRFLLRGDSSQRVALPSGGMTLEVADDGRSAVIRNAGELFGSRVEFACMKGNELLSRCSFFTVKGQPAPEHILTRIDPTESNVRVPVLYTDSQGERLYGCIPDTGEILRFEKGQFSTIYGSSLKESLEEYLLAQGMDRYRLANQINLEQGIESQDAGSEGKLYRIVKVTLSSQAGADADQQTIYYLALMDLSGQPLRWTFTPIHSEGFPENPFEYKYAAAGNILYGVAAKEGEGTTVFAYDMTSDKVSFGETLPQTLFSPCIAVNCGVLYLFFGSKMAPSDDDQNSGKANDFQKSFNSVVYRYDGSHWSELPEIPYAGKHNKLKMGSGFGIPVPVKEGFVFVSTSADGAGNNFLYRTDTGVCEPLYCTFNDSLAEINASQSAVETREGIYYICDAFDQGNKRGYELWRLEDKGLYHGYFSGAAEPADSRSAAEASQEKPPADGTESGVPWALILTVTGVILALGTGIVVWLVCRRRKRA